MATNGGKIQYTIGFNVDKTGLQEIEKSLNVIKNLGKIDILNMNPALGSIDNAASAMQKVRNSVSQIETAFKNAFDPTIGITNITKLNQNLQNAGLLEKIKVFLPNYWDYNYVHGLVDARAGFIGWLNRFSEQLPAYVEQLQNELKNIPPEVLEKISNQTK